MSSDPSRVVRSKKTARKHYSFISRWYDIIAGGSEDNFRKEGIKALSAQPEENILEIGFGTGKSLVQIANAVGYEGMVVGIDMADGMADRTSQRLRRHHLTERVPLCVSDGAILPFKTNFFDAIFLSFTLELFDTPDILQVINQCKQVLIENGRIVIVSLKKSDHAGLIERFYEWFHVKMPVLVDCRPIKGGKYLEQAGFRVDNVITRTMWGLPVEIITAVNRS